MSINLELDEERGLIRPIERHDLAVVAGLIARARRYAPPAPHDPALEPALFGPAPTLAGYVAERFGYVVGYALLGGAADDLYVLEGSRGLGLGTRLAAAAQKARVMPTSTLTR